MEAQLDHSFMISLFARTEQDPVHLRNLGNEHFKQHEYQQAIACYTKSLARSPAGSRLRGLAYANRSAVLLSLGHYKESLADAQTALANDYPQEMVFKLYMRMGICKKMMGKKSEAAEDFLLSIEKVDEDIALGIEKKKELKKKVIKQCVEEGKPRYPQVFVEYLKPPMLSFGPNPLEPKLSSAVVKLKDSTSLVAKRRIEVGDVLAIEDPLAYSTIALPEHRFGLYCSECLKMCLNLFPCTSCSWACYCSEECSKAAWEKYHKTGCAAMESLLEKLSKDNDCVAPLIFSTVTLAFTCIAAFGLENCVAAYQKQDIYENAPKVVKDFIKANVYQNFDDFVIDGLVMEHVADSLHLTGERKKNFVFFLDHMLTNSTIFGKRSRVITQASVSCGGSSTLESYSLRSIGSGCYQLLGPVDLSCDPNVVINFHQKTLVLRALRPIKKGEKLYMSPGTEFQFHFAELVPRQQFLFKIQGVKCSCAACTGNWRTQPDQPFCHDDTLIQNSTLVSRFMDLDMVSFQGALSPAPLFTVSKVTTERYKDCVKIVSLYEDQRRDDHLSLITSNFLRIFYSSSAMRFTVGSPVGDCVDHRLVPFVPH